MSSDLIAYTQSVESSMNSNVMQDKKWLEVMDENNGSYQSSQCTLTTTSLSTSDRLINYKEGYLQIPLVLTASKVSQDSDGDGLAFTNTENLSQMFGLKNSYTSLIHSMSVDLAGTAVIQNTPFSELYNSFVLMTTLSYGDIITQGASIGFYPDEACSASMSSANGGVPDDTLFNNRTHQLVDTTTNVVSQGQCGDGVNKGFVERMKYINFDPTLPLQITGEEHDCEDRLLPLDKAQQLHKSCIYKRSNADGAEIVQTQVNAIVKLKHLHNLFSNLPMARGLNFRFIINFNCCTTEVDTTKNNVILETERKNAFGGVNPLMVANAAAGQGGSPFAQTATGAGNAKVKFDVSVGRTCLDTNITTGSPSLLETSVKLCVPAYMMAPSLASAYLSSSTNRKVTYTDIYQFKLANVGPNGQYNSLVTNGIRGIKSVLVMPMVSATDTDTNIVEYKSVFSDCGGGTTLAHAQQSNFQIQIGGVNQLQNGARYEAETFLNYVYGCNSTNAGQTDGLTSGLINQQQWASKYLYYYIDVNRGSELETDVPKSIQLQGTNNSLKTIDLFCFVEFEQSFSLDCSTGAIVS